MPLDLSILRSEKWQAKHLKYGQTVVNSSEVKDTYDAYAAALTILGRDDIASVLSDRLTIQFIAQHAGILTVIKGLVGDPTSKPLPALNSTKVETWDEIIANDPLIGDHWDSIEDDLSESESSEGAGSIYLTPDQTVDIGPTLKTARNPQLIQLPLDLTDQDVLREVKLALLGYKSRLSDPSLLFTSRTLSQTAFLGIIADFANILRTLDNLRLVARNPVFGDVISHILADTRNRILVAEPKTLLQALVCYRGLTAPLRYLEAINDNPIASLESLYARPEYSSIFSLLIQPYLKAVNLWLQGIFHPLIVTESPVTWDSEVSLNVPSFLQHNQLVSAGRAAVILRNLKFNVHLTEYSQFSPSSYLLFIGKAADRNNVQLMSYMRPKLVSAWKLLGDVYLAQDSRMLDFIYECQHSTRSPLAVVTEVWPNAPFVLKNGIPTVDINELAAYFNMKQLEACWHAIVSAMTASDHASLETQLRVMELYRDVLMDIESTPTLKCFANQKSLS